MSSVNRESLDYQTEFHAWQWKRMATLILQEHYKVEYILHANAQTPALAACQLHLRKPRRKTDKTGRRPSVSCSLATPALASLRHLHAE